MNTTKPFIHLINNKSPELHEIHERLKLVAAAYLRAFDDNIQDIGLPQDLSKYLTNQIIEQIKCTDNSLVEFPAPPGKVITLIVEL